MEDKDGKKREGAVSAKPTISTSGTTPTLQTKRPDGPKAAPPEPAATDSSTPLVVPKTQALVSGGIGPKQSGPVVVSNTQGTSTAPNAVAGQVGTSAAAEKSITLAPSHIAAPGSQKPGTSGKAPISSGNKKRKLASSPTNAAQLQFLENLPLTYFDPAVQQTTRDLVTLLESYGALTAAQLEYNLPPVKKNSFSSNTIQSILDILTGIGFVQIVEEDKEPKPKPQIITANAPSNGLQSTTNQPKPADAVANATSASTATATQTATTSSLKIDSSTLSATNVPSVGPKKKPDVRYCICRGVPRADVVLPHQLEFEIREAHQQAQQSFSRSRLLLEALRDNTDATTTLKELLKRYPEIAHDPVYVTALRSCQIDVPVTQNPTPATSPKSRKGVRAAASTKGASKISKAPKKAAVPQPLEPAAAAQTTAPKKTDSTDPSITAMSKSPQEAVATATAVSLEPTSSPVTTESVKDIVINTDGSAMPSERKDDAAEVTA